MLGKKTLLTASNLNSAFISKTDTNSQNINSNLTISGGALTLKNSVITDNANTGYMRIDPQGNNVIIYDGVNNQRLDVFSSSGSESTYMQTTNATKSFGQIDVSTAVDHFEINTNSKKAVLIGGQTQVLNGNDFILKATSTDPGDIIFQASDGTEYARLYASSGGTLSLSTGTNSDAQILVTSSAINLNYPTTVSGKVTTTTGGVDIQGSGNALSFTFGGGGFNMTDTTWIRTMGGKSLYQASGTMRTDGSLQVGAGTTLQVDNGGSFNFGSGKFTISSAGIVASTGPINLTTAKSSGSGIKLDGVTIDTVIASGSVAIGGLQQLRFGDSTSFNWNVWGGIKFDSTNLKMYIGGPASTQFSSNANPPTIDVAFTGVGNLGIGIDTPTRKLDVNGDLRTNGAFYSATGSLNFLTDSGNALPIKVGSLAITSNYSNNAPSNGLYVEGNVGIGNSTPSYKLDVSGNIRATNGIYANANNSAGVYLGDDSALWDINVANTMAIYGQQNTAVGALKLGSTGPVLYGSGGNLGIGTTTPAYNLDINGDIRIGSNNAIYSGYNNAHIIKDFGNGNVTLSASGSLLYLGYQNTTGVRLSASLVYGSGNTPIADTSGMLYYKGNDTDGRYLLKSGDTMTGPLTVASNSITITGSAGTALTFDRGRTNNSTIYWNASPTVDYGMVFKIDGTTALTLTSSGGATIPSNLTVNGGFLYGQFGTIAQSTDEWLRLNCDTHTNGTYFGSGVVRTDGEFQVGTSGNYFKANSSGVTATSISSPSVTISGFDFVLGNGDQSTRGNSGASRAIVKDSGNKLVLNYAMDFTGGVEVQSDMVISKDTPKIELKGNGSPGIELRSLNGGTPYIDFSNDSSSDFDARIVLVGDNEIQITGANTTMTGGARISGTYEALFSGWNGALRFDNGSNIMIYNAYSNIGIGLHSTKTFFFTDISGAKHLAEIGDGYIKSNGNKVFVKGTNLTYGTATPSGGESGDVYIQI